MDIPETVSAYYAAKQRDIPRGRIDPASDLLHALDAAVVTSLAHRGCPTPDEKAAVDAAFEAVLSAPGSRWTRETLNYRLRVLHYS